MVIEIKLIIYNIFPKFSICLCNHVLQVELHSTMTIPLLDQMGESFTSEMLM
jgi:hypothetical protein